EQAHEAVKAAETAYASAKMQYGASHKSVVQQLEQARGAERVARKSTTTTFNPDGTAVSTTATGDPGAATQARIAAEQAVQQARLELDANLQPYKAQLDAAREAYQQARQGARYSHL